MSLINVILLLNIFFSIFCTITTLPVTSKPIENTPEHLAWEAWIMVPSTNDKSRKITPKSIFIVPNGVNGNGLNTGNSGNEKNGSNLVLQCPPGHTVDNFKCIPTVNIDQSQILITRLTNLVHSTDKYNGSNDDLNDNYDYDYEYDTFKADESQSFTLNNNKNGNKNNVLSSTSLDYSSEPLKINLSLEKFPLVKTDVKENVNNKTQNIEEINENIFVENMFKENSNNFSIVENVNKKTNETFNGEDKENNNITTTPIIDSEIIDLPVISKFSSNFSEANNNITNVVLSSNFSNSFETEIPTEIIKNRNSTVTNNNDQNSDLDDEQTHINTTTENEIELITNADIKNDALQDEIVYDSLILEGINSKTTTTVVDDNTETKLQIFSTTPFYEDINESNTNSAFVVQDTFSQDNLTILESSNNSAITKKELPITMENSFSNSSNEQKFNESTKIDYDVSSPMEEVIKNNGNRFLYHYLDSSNLSSNQQPFQKVQTDASEQIRVINKIVEENKKKIETIQQQSATTDQHSKIKFPENVQSHMKSNYNYNHHNHNTDDNLHSDYVKFPKDTPSSLSPIISMPPILHKPLQSDSFYSSNRFLHTPSSSSSSSSSIQQPFIKPSVISPSINTGNINNNNFQQNLKPFWWLPTGWEVDRTGDRPMMVRFWSRIPIEPLSNSNNYHQIQTSPSIITTTNRYRENSRSPTENLYRQETLAQENQQNLQQQQKQQQQFRHQEHQQDVYSIKRTKQWKHNDR